MDTPKDSGGSNDGQTKTEQTGDYQIDTILQRFNISLREFLSGAIVIFILYVNLGGIFYHLVEKWNWLDSYYFTFVTLATVGYGDFVPKTPEGKIFTMAYIFLGVGFFITVANFILKNRGTKRVAKMTERREKHEARRAARQAARAANHDDHSDDSQNS